MIWSKVIGSEEIFSATTDIAIDKSNNYLYVSGGLLLPDFGNIAMVMKFTKKGGLLWSRALTYGDYSFAWSIATDRYGKIIIAGDTVASDEEYMASSKDGYGGYYEVFVAKFDNDGGLEWDRLWGGMGYDYMLFSEGFIV